jgi:hypothetical protein
VDFWGCPIQLLPKTPQPNRLQINLTIRRRGLKLEQVTEAAALYEKGKSLAWLGARYDVSHTTVAAELRKQGIQLRARRGWL